MTTITRHRPHTLTAYRGRRLDIASLLLTRCTLCGRYEVGQPLGECAACGGRRRLATVGEIFESEQDAERDNQ